MYSSRYADSKKVGDTGVRCLREFPWKNIRSIQLSKYELTKALTIFGATVRFRLVGWGMTSSSAYIWVLAAFLHRWK